MIADCAMSIFVSMPDEMPDSCSRESSRLSIRSSWCARFAFADDARQVKVAVNAMPPMNNDNGRRVDSLMMPEPDCDATPTPASAIPDEVQMNCDRLSIVFEIIERSFYSVESTATISSIVTTARPPLIIS